MLIGSIGAHLNSLAALALYMLEYPIHPVDCTYPNTFLDGLRSAVRQAGCDGKTTTVLFTVSINWSLLGKFCYSRKAIKVVTIASNYCYIFFWGGGIRHMQVGGSAFGLFGSPLFDYLYCFCIMVSNVCNKFYAFKNCTFVI